MWEFLLGLFFGMGLVMWISALGVKGEKVQKKLNDLRDKLPKEKVSFHEPIDKEKQWREAGSLNDILE